MVNQHFLHPYRNEDARSKREIKVEVLFLDEDVAWQLSQPWKARSKRYDQPDYDQHHSNNHQRPPESAHALPSFLFRYVIE